MAKVAKAHALLQEELGHHPSPIAKAAIGYVHASKLAESTKRDHGLVLSLFVESLKHDPEFVRETDDGEFVLNAKWDDVYGGTVGNFVDWWLHRKWVGSDEIARKAPGVLKKWFKWCLNEGHIDLERCDDFLEALPKSKAAEMKRLQLAGELLYRLHSPNPGSWRQPDPDKVVALMPRRAPEDLAEGYMTVTRLDGPSCWLVDAGGDERGPVFVGEVLSECLREGDVINVTIGQVQGAWKVLESGNVYAEGTLF